MIKKGTVLTVILIFCLFAALFWVLPDEPTHLSFGLGAGVAFILTLYYVFSGAIERRRIKGPAIWIPGQEVGGDNL
jgi:hypothetical protein